MNIDKATQSAFTYYHEGKLDEAKRVCEKILAKKPNNFNALHLLGIIYYQLEQFTSSIKFLQKAIQHDPNIAEAFCNLGAALYRKGQLDEAITHYQKALELNPDYAEAYYNLGTALQEKKQLNDAITHYRKALELNPDYAEAYYNLGTALQEKKQLNDAITCFQKALQFNPYLSDAYYSTGNILSKQGRQDEAISFYNKALNCNAQFLKARWARCMSQIPIIYSATESIQIYRGRYHDELLNLVNSISLETQQEIKNAADAVGYLQPFYLAYQGLNDKDLQQLYGSLVCKIMTLRYPEWSQSITTFLSSEEPVKVGIISGYFYRHSVWKIPIKGWIENLNKERVKLYGYHTGTKKDDQTEVARRHFTKFVEDVYSFEQLCKIIRDDNLHVIIYPEIGMDPITLRLAALRFAPIQCASWGHPVTAGLPSIDYFLSGDLIEPSDADNHYTETLVRLPNLSIYYSPPEMSQVEVDRSEFGLDPYSVIYHCCQTLYKYLPQYDNIYPRIVQELRNCKFLFSSYEHGSKVTEQFRLRIRDAFNKFNLNADDYVVFLPFLEQKVYNALYNLSDVFLDPIGWSGCNSVLEAINRNLPVVTYPSKLMRGREGSAILTMMGLIEIIPQSVDDYIKIAIRLGRNSEWRKQISEKIAANKHRVYRDKTCITGLEDFLEKVVKEKLK